MNHLHILRILPWVPLTTHLYVLNTPKNGPAVHTFPPAKSSLLTVGLNKIIDERNKNNK